MAKAKILIISLIVIFFLQTGVAFALEINYPPVPGADAPQVFMEKIKNGSIPENQAFPLYVKYILTLFAEITVLVCIGAITYGGILYLISPTKPANLVEAKKWILNAVLALLFLTSSLLVLFAISPEFGVFKTKPEQRPTEPYVENPFVEQNQISYWEIPVGQIIEDLVITPKAKERLQRLLDTAKKVKDESNKLNEKMESLKYAIDHIYCGESKCKEKFKIHYKATGNRISFIMIPWCEAHGCDYPDENFLYRADIQNKVKEIEKEIANLETARRELVQEQQVLITDYLALKKAGLLMSLPGSVYDYNNFIYVKKDFEQEGIDVNVVSLFPSLPSALSQRSFSGKIRDTIKQLEDVLAGSEGENIKNKTTDIDNKIKPIIEQIKKSENKIDIALSKKTNFTILTAKNSISTLLSETFLSDTTIEQVKRDFDDIETNASNLRLKTEEARDKAQIIEDHIKQKCKAAKDRLAGVITTEKNNIKTKNESITGAVDDIGALKEISSILTRLRTEIEAIGGQKAPIVDPATFYFIKQKE